MEIAIFKKYNNGYYTFEFENGEYLVFEEVHPKVLVQYDLKNNQSLKDVAFKLTFSEIIVDAEDDFIIYRIDTLIKL